jgi:uncharacterized protein YqgV (UPF0045/DUF77 family)
MPVMEISFSNLEEGVRGGNDFVTSCILLAKQRGVKCELKPTRIIVEGDKEVLLEILQELDHISFNTGADKKISISLKIDEGQDKPLAQAEISSLNGGMENHVRRR